MNFMNNTAPIIIGIDHGYGNIKTAHCCFKTGVAAYNKEPTFKSNLLIYEGKYYLIGEEHKEFVSDKMTDIDYYILTLAAIAREPGSTISPEAVAERPKIDCAYKGMMTDEPIITKYSSILPSTLRA